MADLYEKNLWGKIEFLHERYNREHTHISNFLDMMTRFQNACSDFSKAMTAIINKKYILTESNTSTIYKSMENYYKCISAYSESFNEIFESLKLNISTITQSITESFQKEKEIYNIYLKTASIYNNSKINLDKIKKEFKQRCMECETLVYDAKKAKIYATDTPEQITKMERIASESLANTGLLEDKYVKIINEANQSRENDINSQKTLQHFYHNIDSDYYGKIRMMTGFFISCLKRMINSITIEIQDLNDSFNDINVEKDINDFVEKYKTKEEPDPIIKFAPYRPAPELTSDSIIEPNLNEKKDLEISYEVILVFQKIFRFIRTDLNMEEERNKNKLRILSNKIIRPGENVSYSPKEKNELYTFLNNPKYRSSFILIISKQRTKGFKKNQKLLNDLGEIFSHILEIAEKEKDFDSAINCVILSQTYYCEINNNKKYLFDGIKNNKWLTQIEFWENVINLMIKKEAEKNKEKNENKQKENIKKIAVTQIFNYSDNMIDFNIKNDEIYNLIEKLSKKYEIDKEDYDSIISTIKDKLVKNGNKIYEKDKKEEDKKDINNDNKNDIENIKLDAD